MNKKLVYFVSEGKQIDGRWFWSNKKMDPNELHQFLLNMTDGQKITVTSKFEEIKEEVKENVGENLF